jgi:hypothetical protein
MVTYNSINTTKEIMQDTLVEDIWQMSPLTEPLLLEVNNNLLSETVD